MEKFLYVVVGGMIWAAIIGWTFALLSAALWALLGLFTGFSALWPLSSVVLSVAASCGALGFAVGAVQFYCDWG